MRPPRLPHFPSFFKSYEHKRSKNNTEDSRRGIYPITLDVGVIWAFFNCLQLGYGRFVPSAMKYTQSLKNLDVERFVNVFYLEKTF